MKRLSLLALPLVFLFASCVAVFPFDGLVGNGKVATYPLNLSHFDAIRNYSSAKVVVARGSSPGASVTIDSNLLEALDIRVESNTLIVSLKPGKSIVRYSKFVVDAVTPALAELGTYGSGPISCADNFSGTRMRLSTNGSGNLSGAFDYYEIEAAIGGSGSIGATCIATTLKATVVGSGDIVLKGGAKDITARIGGSGSVLGEGFRAETADLSIYGSGSISCRVSDRLSAAIGGSGNINYYGNPWVESRDNGSGSVRRLGL
ncbi:MAG: hypothetical protein FD137_2664 [Spirochaetes bacterium]|nr:MAG: hypothetical protein FD137_2664 [Spirochaetota bacterium]